MRIIVCVKQVPNTGQVEVDPERGTLKREGVDSKLNVYDAHALEAAVVLAEAHGGTVTALSMGPPQAEQVLREAFALGADEGVLLADRSFAGADTLATSYTLAHGIMSIGFDLIICGMQTTDGDTGQVGPGIAEVLGIPHVSYVRKVEGLTDEGVRVEVDMQDRVERAVIRRPCLLTVTREANQPRLPSLRRLLASEGKQIARVASDDLSGADSSHFGLDGSPTQVERVYPPVSSETRERWEGMSSEEVAARLAERLKEMRIL